MYRLVVLLLAVPLAAQIVPIDPNAPVSTGPAIINANFTFLANSKVAIWSGAGVPGSIPLSVLGDFYVNLTPNPPTTYQCARATACNAVANGNWQLVGGGGVTSVGFTGGIISVGTPTTTPAFTVAGTSGGIPYFSAASAWASSGVLGAGQFVLGGGAGATPSTSFSVVPAANGGTGQSSYTKGDTICPSAATTITKLAVGTDGQTLTADAASTCGIKWGSTASGVVYSIFRAINQNTVSGSNFSIPAANAPAMTSVEGASSGDVTTASSAWNYGTLSFAANGSSATSNSVQGQIFLPSTWSSAAGISLLVKWRTSATSGNVSWRIQGQCVATSAVPGNFGSAVAMTASTAPGTTLQWKDTAVLTLTTSDVLSGCAAGNMFLFRFYRDHQQAADTLTVAAELILAAFGVTQ